MSRLPTSSSAAPPHALDSASASKPQAACSRALRCVSMFFLLLRSGLRDRRMHDQHRVIAQLREQFPDRTAQPELILPAGQRSSQDQEIVAAGAQLLQDLLDNGA